jgi:ABC-2 type transport system ATP-binding protein
MFNGKIIETHGLTRVFGNLRAVDGIDLNVDSGTIFGLLGPNGSGKTTTIRLLLGLIEPTGGSAVVLGQDTRRGDNEIRKLSGALLEQTGLYERLSAYDNLDFYGRVWHLPAKERSTRIQELLEGLGLWDRRGEIVNNWSRGMKQKLAVARVLVHRPQLIFLDEPTAGLDPVAASSLLDDLQQMVKQQGVTVFLTTHNLNEAEKLCDQVAVIRQGKVISDGSPDELRLQQGSNRLEVVGRGFTESLIAQLKLNPEVSSVTREDHHLSLDLKNSVDTSKLVRWLVEQGVEIDEVRKGKASLEEVFLELVKDPQESK